MLSSHSLPETQAALALSIFFATFIYEDGATLLAASLSAGGSLDPRIKSVGDDARLVIARSLATKQSNAG